MNNLHREEIPLSSAIQKVPPDCSGGTFIWFGVSSEGNTDYSAVRPERSIP